MYQRRVADFYFVQHVSCHEDGREDSQVPYMLGQKPEVILKLHFCQYRMRSHILFKFLNKSITSFTTFKHSCAFPCIVLPQASPMAKPPLKQVEALQSTCVWPVLSINPSPVGPLPGSLLWALCFWPFHLSLLQTQPLPLAINSCLSSKLCPRLFLEDCTPALKIQFMLSVSYHWLAVCPWARMQTFLNIILKKS